MPVDVNQIYNEDCLATMARMPAGLIDLTVTSPPYDQLRKYNGYTFDFPAIARELYRVTKPGGVVVWIVADATVKGSETGSSFRQALGFMEIGFSLHDTMIWYKQSIASIGGANRYENVFEYMFVLSRGKPKATNIIRDKENRWAGVMQHGSIRQIDGTVRRTTGYGVRQISKYGRRHNVWSIPPVKSKKKVGLHPAPFPERLAADHILTWSNPGDLVYDPMIGSGTTAAAALAHGRQYLGSEISAEYCAIAAQRLAQP